MGVASALAIGGVLLPFRSHIGSSTTALILVIPVVVGAVIGGFTAGAASVAGGFLVYDYLFIPPYRTLSVGQAQNWTALAVYVVVMLLVARVVDILDSTRTTARRSEEVMRRVSEMSELLVADQPVEVLLRNIVTTAQIVFAVPGVSLLELEEGRLVVVASAGEPLTPEELRQLDPHSGHPVRVGTSSGHSTELRTIALSPSGRPVGILAMRGIPILETDRAVLSTFANDAALALERAQLREQALRTKLLEEADRFRRGLLGAVSHDLRTPLATIKVASSTLLTRGESLSASDSKLLHQLIEIESDRLTRLVTNLLDMTRIEAGVLTLNRVSTSVKDVINDAVSSMTLLARRPSHRRRGARLPARRRHRSRSDRSGPHQPLDNAVRHAPANSVITVKGERRGHEVVISVADTGPGVPVADRETIFDRFVSLSTGGRAGLGLTIAKTFVEAHGERVWYEEVTGGGARFVVSLPSPPARTALVATVLVIDDDHSLLRALRLGLEAEGHDVTTALNGERGISLTALHAPDVVVLDIGLPDLDGLVVTERIRQWSGVPIIILSATGDPDRKIEALNIGADDYVTKPFSMGELEARIRAVLRNRPNDTGRGERVRSLGRTPRRSISSTTRCTSTAPRLISRQKSSTCSPSSVVTLG